jgi:hypothetical protein
LILAGWIPLMDIHDKNQKSGATPTFFACVALTFAGCLAKYGAAFTAPPECDKKMRQVSDVLFDWGR